MEVKIECGKKKTMERSKLRNKNGRRNTKNFGRHKVSDGMRVILERISDFTKVKTTKMVRFWL